ncbi:MAG TPA: zf-HC2 domain-containing protein, partial [Actinomycetota bacterium]|nr:zf-HC2 domain-containing protein [Actinomycetota bacterium]
ALGIAPGEERARVLAHVRGCGDCRRLLDGLAETADLLLVLAPRDEPSSGFESAALARMTSRHRRARSRLLVASAAALVGAALAAGAVLFVTADDRSLASRYRAALAEANGKYFGVVPLRTTSGERAGHLFAYEGEPSWLVFVFDAPPDGDEHTIRIETRGGSHVELAAGNTSEDLLAWGRDIPTSLREISAVQVLDARKAVVATAVFPEP